MNLAKMTARVRHPVTSDGKEAGSAGMLTVNVGVNDDDANAPLVTSHSHSAGEIVAAFKAGMQVQAVVTAGEGGNQYIIAPLMSIYSSDEEDTQIMFANPMFVITVAAASTNEMWFVGTP